MYLRKIRYHLRRLADEDAVGTIGRPSTRPCAEPSDMAMSTVRAPVEVVDTLMQYSVACVTIHGRLHGHACRRKSEVGPDTERWALSCASRGQASWAVDELIRPRPSSPSPGSIWATDQVVSSKRPR